MVNFVIAETLNSLSKTPEAFSIIGAGARNLAVADPSHPDAVLILQDGHNKGIDKHHKAVTFANMMDGLFTERFPKNFTHSDLLGHAVLDRPLIFKYGKERAGRFIAARLFRRIPGKSLDYRDFMKLSSTMTGPQRKTLAKDIALYLFTLHRHINPEAKRILAKAHVNGVEIKEIIKYKISKRYRHYVWRNHGFWSDTLKKVKDNPSGQEALTAKKQLGHFNLSADKTAALTTRLKEQIDISLTNERGFFLLHGDFHPGNILATTDRSRITGVCDWAEPHFDRLVVDFFALGLAPQLLSDTLHSYDLLSKKEGAASPINHELAHAFAAMYCLKQISSGLTRKDPSKSFLRLAWGQVLEHVEVLATLNPAAHEKSMEEIKSLYLGPERPVACGRKYTTHLSRT